MTVTRTLTLTLASNFQLVREIIDAKVEKWSIPPKELSLGLAPVSYSTIVLFSTVQHLVLFRINILAVYLEDKEHLGIALKNYLSINYTYFTVCLE